jgi:hypothetical protein
MADIPDDGETFLDGLTITGGMGANRPGTISVKGYNIDKQSGGGMYLVNASPVLKNVRIENNRATSSDYAGGGGGIYNLSTGSGQESRPLLTDDTTVTTNSVLGGAAAAVCTTGQHPAASVPRFLMARFLTGTRRGASAEGSTTAGISTIAIIIIAIIHTEPVVPSLRVTARSRGM